MLTVISPAKRLDWSPRDVPTSEPRLQAEANILAGHARQLGLAGLAGLMDLSPDLARLNRDRFRAMEKAPTGENARPAIFAFAGDTYQGLEAASLDPGALGYADSHLRILSGLYGLLRPRDAIQAYRLEMGVRLKSRRGNSLYAFWGGRITEMLRADAEAAGAALLLNCASQEYFGAVQPGALGIPVITPAFLEEKDGRTRMVSFHAKRARGAMARFALEERPRRAEDLEAFTAGGYRFEPDLSEPGCPVFLRPSSLRPAG